MTQVASGVPPARAHRLNEWAPALLFLTVYLAPTLFGPAFPRSIRSTALMQIFLWWTATGLAALLLTRADADFAATRRRCGSPAASASCSCWRPASPTSSRSRPRWRWRR